MTDKLDGGDILLQKDLYIGNSMTEIWNDIYSLSEEMIKDILVGKYERRPQVGIGSYYKRRTPAQSRIEDADFCGELEKAADFIRMLGEPYPSAYIRKGTKKILFRSAYYSDHENPYDIYAGKKIVGMYEIREADDNRPYSNYSVDDLEKKFSGSIISLKELDKQ